MISLLRQLGNNRTLKTFARVASQIPGYHTKRKILVIESDDWGSIRTTSVEALLDLRRKGYPVDDNPYNRVDALETNKDVSALMDVLLSVKNDVGQHPVMTLNNVVANPDFFAIKKSNFKKYFYEPFTETLQRSEDRNKVFDLFKEGVKAGIFQPQFHGREHLHINRWMQALSSRETHVLDGFKWNMYSFRWKANNPNSNEYLDAFDCDGRFDIQLQQSIIREGVSLFQKIWGFPSESFIANCYTWHPLIEKTLRMHEVKYMQGLTIQFKPKLSEGFTRTKKYHYTGEKSKEGLLYLVRNAFFEPSVYPNKDWIKEAINRIGLSFTIQKPAILSTHRLNFIGAINEVNREVNLDLFKKLLEQIVVKWPDVEFMSTDKLGRLISNKIID